MGIAWESIKTLYHHADQNDVLHAASAMAFDLFLGIIPLLALAGYVVGWLSRRGSELAVEMRLFDFAPGPAAEIARQQFERLEVPGSSIAPYATFGFLWLSSSGAHVALSTVRKILGQPERSYFKTRALAFLFTFLFALVALTSSLGMMLIRRRGFVGGLTQGEVLGWRITVLALTFVFATSSVALLYRMAGGRKHTLWPGALFAVVTFTLVSIGFSHYVQTISRYAAFYGGLAAVAMLLVWLWLSSITLLLGAEVNAIIDKPPRSVIENLVPRIRLLLRPDEPSRLPPS